jgi:4,5-DOPA dioxygenase extradiol
MKYFILLLFACFAEWSFSQATAKITGEVSENATNQLLDAVVHYRTEAPHAQRAHPTEEHFLPLLVALGAQGEGDAVAALDGGITHGMLSMDSFAWGLQ